MSSTRGSRLRWVMNRPGASPNCFRPSEPNQYDALENPSYRASAAYAQNRTVRMGEYIVGRRPWQMRAGNFGRVGGQHDHVGVLLLGDLQNAFTWRRTVIDLASGTYGNAASDGMRP